MKIVNSVGFALCSSVMAEAFVVRPVLARRCVTSKVFAATAAATDPLSYSLASQNLSQSWIQLVQEGKVSATVNLNDETVRYGVTWKDNRCREFVEGTSPRIRELQSALEATGPQQIITTDDGYVAQLPLLRTLRPPPSPGFSGATTSVPPPYDASTDSFVTGPLRLQLRPIVATLSLPQLETPWQVYHNVSPADVRGHFLLIPSLDETTKNCRAQVLTPADCRDLVHLAASNTPVGSLFIGFNSVGAAASQNHIHAHAWPAWDYAASNATSIFDYFDLDNGVEVTWLEYPVFCVEMSSSNGDALGDAVAAVLNCIGDAPYNVGFLNRQDEDGEVFTDVYIFARSQERSQTIPELKLGISEMMGVFHAQSPQELELLGTDDAMSQALSNVTYYDENALWKKIQETLLGGT